MVSRFDVYLVNLDPEPSKDAKNTRPCVVVSPDEINGSLQNVIIAPLSSKSKKYPTRVAVEFLNNHRSIVLDQIRAVDKRRLLKRLGQIATPAQQDVLRVLAAMFAP